MNNPFCLLSDRWKLQVLYSVFFCIHYFSDLEFTLYCLVTLNQFCKFGKTTLPDHNYKVNPWLRFQPLTWDQLAILNFHF